MSTCVCGLPQHTGPARSWRGRPEGPWEPAPRHVLASRSRAAPTSGGTKAMGAPCAESPSPSPAGRLVPGEHPSAERGLRRIPEQEALGAPAPRREPDPGLRVHFAVCHQCPAGRASAQGPGPCGCNTLRRHQVEPRGRLLTRLFSGSGFQHPHCRSNLLPGLLSSSARQRRRRWPQDPGLALDRPMRGLLRAWGWDPTPAPPVGPALGPSFLRSRRAAPAGETRGLVPAWNCLRLPGALSASPGREGGRAAATLTFPALKTSLH